MTKQASSSTHHPRRSRRPSVEVFNAVSGARAKYSTESDRRVKVVQVKRVDYRDNADRAALLEVLNAYALDPMGGNEPLPNEVRARLCDDLQDFPGAVSFLAWDGAQPVGLVNGFVGYSTFKARRLINVHDIAVVQTHRAQGIGKLLLQSLQDYAVSIGCCKLTLEVLSGNVGARHTYLKFGFEDYALDPEAGTAMFMQKWL